MPLTAPSAAAFLAPTENLTVYVSKGGSDSNPGTPSQPFATIAAAIESIDDASASKRYQVVVGPGLFTDDIVLKPFVFVTGAGTRETVVSPDNHVTLDPSVKTVADARTGMSNIGLTNFKGFSCDLSAMAGSESCLVRFYNVNFDDLITFTAKGVDYFEAVNCVCWGDATFNGGSILLDNLRNNLGGFVLTAPVECSAQIRQGWFTQNCSISTATANNVSCDMMGCTLFSNISVTETSTGVATLSADVLPSTVNIAGGAVVNLKQLGKFISYTPTTSGNWPDQPVNVGDALDKLAARLAAIEP